MTVSVYKYQLDATRTQTLKMPVGAEVLSVGVQRGIVCLWARVVKENPLEDRTFHILGTGHEAGDHKLGLFVGTAMLADGDLVFHVFQDVDERVRETHDYSTPQTFFGETSEAFSRRFVQQEEEALRLVALVPTKVR